MVWDHHVAKFDAPAVDVGGRISATVQSPSALSRPAGPYFFGSNQPTGRDGPQLVRSCSVAEVPSTLTAIVDSTLPHPFRPPPSPPGWSPSRREHCAKSTAKSIAALTATPPPSALTAVSEAINAAAQPPTLATLKVSLAVTLISSSSPRPSPTPPLHPHPRSHHLPCPHPHPHSHTLRKLMPLGCAGEPAIAVWSWSWSAFALDQRR